MATGAIQTITWAVLGGLAGRTVDRSAQLYTPFAVPRKDVGYVTRPKKIAIFMFNGTSADAVLSGISGNEDAEGIAWDATPPDAVAALSSIRIIITITDEGPLEYEAVLAFEGTCTADPVLTIVGTRAWKLSGDIGYLFFPHNWQNGFDESLAWKTDVLTAHDRTDQRVQMRTCPRRVFSLDMLAAGADRRKLDQWIAGRQIRKYFFPVWRDLGKTLAAVVEGGGQIPVVTAGYDYAVDRYVATWDGEKREIHKITGIGPEYVAIESPLLYDWPAGATVAPCRIGIATEQRALTRWTEDVGQYKMTVTLMNETLMPALESPELYRGVMVCPIRPSWSPDGEESVGNHWITLDNETGVLEYDIRSVEPVFSRDLAFVLISRVQIDRFLRFLFACAGRLAPFWVASAGREFELAEDVAEGQGYLVIENIDYVFSLAGSPARSHIELVATDGAVIRRMITSVETRPDGSEKLYLDSPMDRALSASILNRCAWLELVRLDADEINLHWVDGNCMTATIPIMVLP